MEGLYECVEKCTNGSFKLVINVSSTCVDQCPADHYVAASDTCRACNILCSPLHGCSGQEARQCVRCRYAEQDDVCVAACPQGSVERNTTGVVNVKAPIQCQRQINVTDPGGNDPDDSPASIVGAGVGAGVGCVIAAVIVLVSLVYGRRRYNKWKKERQQDPSLVCLLIIVCNFLLYVMYRHCMQIRESPCTMEEIDRLQKKCYSGLFCGR